VTTVEIAAGPRDAWLAIEANGWGDGLPCIPPTRDLVEEMLADIDPDEVIASIPPSGGDVTNELAAANAVMAGCLPGSLRVVRAALQAFADPAFNPLSIQTTTNPAAALVVVNGPVRHELGFESGAGCMGAGRTNLTIGRAVRLILANVGDAKPGLGDRASHGFPGKVSFCFAEAEEASPWAPLSTRASIPAETSAVTVVSASGTTNVLELGDADDVLHSIVSVLAAPGSNDAMFGGTPMVVLPPELAELFNEKGMSKSDVQRILWERGTVRAGDMSTPNREMMAAVRTAEYGTIEDDTDLHVAQSPDDLLLVVAGGPGTHAVYVPTFGLSHAVTRAVT
jgi:hypothetical protein